jgi:peroxiredoxin
MFGRIALRQSRSALMMQQRHFSLRVGSDFPAVQLKLGLLGPFLKTDKQYFDKNKRVVVVGLPGAFTPT